jgi:hypothetical protein
VKRFQSDRVALRCRSNKAVIAQQWRSDNAATAQRFQSNREAFQSDGAALRSRSDLAVIVQRLQNDCIIIVIGSLCDTLTHTSITGRVLDKQELEQIAEVLQRYPRVIAVMDEVCIFRFSILPSIRGRVCVAHHLLLSIRSQTHRHTDTHITNTHHQYTLSTHITFALPLNPHIPSPPRNACRCTSTWRTANMSTLAWLHFQVPGSILCRCDAFCPLLPLFAHPPPTSTRIFPPLLTSSLL